MDLDLACVRAFVSLLDEGHFGTAARALHLTTSALSKRIRRLEQHLGALLVERDSSGIVAITPAGRRFAPHARRLLEDERRGRMAASSVAPIVEFRLGVPGMVGDHPERAQLAALARELRRENPRSVLHCYGIPYDRVNSVLLAGGVDALWDTSIVPDRELESVPLDRYERIGVMSRTHPLADAEVLDVAEFADQPMIFNSRVPSQWMSRWYLDDVRPVAKARLVDMRAESAEQVMMVLARSAGVTVGPAIMSNRLGTELRAVRLLGVPETTTFATRRRHDSRPLVLSLLRAMTAVAAASPRD
jgi:DNA-binding transcriptional LysR family regulator